MREYFLLGLVILSVPIVLKKPFWGLVFYLGFNIIRPEMLFWGGNSGSYVFRTYYLLVLFSCLINGHIFNLRRSLRVEIGLMAWLFAAIWVSMLLSPYPANPRASYYLENLAVDFVLCVLMVLVLRERTDLENFTNALIFCMALMAIWGIQQHFLGNVRLEGLGGKARGDSNGVAAMFVLFLPVPLAKFLFSETRRRKFLGLTVTILMVLLVIFTESRAGLLGMGTAFLALAWYSRSVKKVLLTACFAAVVALPFITKGYTQRVETMRSTNTLDDSALSRLVLWKAGLMVFADHPYFGTGFMTYPEAKLSYEDRFYRLDEDFRKRVFTNTKVTHNTYIELLSDCGLVGGIPFILLVLLGIGYGFRARRLLWAAKDDRSGIFLLGAVSAGITGFGVCVITIDAALAVLLYVQITLAFLLGDHVFREVDLIGQQEGLLLEPV